MGTDHEFVPFTATTRMSGFNVDGRQIRKGAADSVRRGSKRSGRQFQVSSRTSSTASLEGGLDTPLVVADGTDILGVIELKDVVKAGHQGEVRRAARKWASAP
jgi:K+-transporting ATPase ATPase B chain